MADIQVNLVPKASAGAKSRHRQTRASARGGDCEEIRRVAVAEVPPGPPSERQNARRRDFTGQPRKPATHSRTEDDEIFKARPALWTQLKVIEEDQPKTRFVIDKERPRCTASAPETISQTLAIAVGGQSVDLLHVPRERRT